MPFYEKVSLMGQKFTGSLGYPLRTKKLCNEMTIQAKVTILLLVKCGVKSVIPSGRT